MTKSPDAFRTISEVADWLGIQAHVLRFWESKFSQVKPVKRAGGRRYYRPSDMQLLGGIRQLLYEDGLTIKGVQKILREQGVNHVAAMSTPLNESAADTPAEDSAVLQDVEDQIVETPVELVDQPASPAEVAEDVSTPEVPEPEIAPENDGEDAQDQLPLPTFAHRRVEERAPDAETPDPIPPDDTPAQPAEPRAVVVDAPDPPHEADISYNPGVLAGLAELSPLGPENVTAAKPLVRALDDWLARVSGAA